MPAGSYYLFFVADVNNNQGKINESVDNVAASPISVSGPDLTVALNSPPSTAVTGDNDKIALSWTVANNSTVDAMGAWSDEVYLSTTPTPNFSSYSSYWNLGDFRPPLNGPLVASGSYTQDKTLTIPGVPAGAGTYYLVVFIDQYGEQPVTSTATDMASTPISLTLPAVNLAVTQATPSTTNLLAGGSYTLAYSVQNQGSDPAEVESWTDSIYLSSRQSYDSSALFVGDYFYSTTTPLLANNSYSASADITIPSSASAGPQYLLIVPDAGQSQAESNTNNAYPVSITVSVPDVKLATTITSSPASPVTIGSTFSLSWQVSNMGTASTTASYWYDTVYLSTAPAYSNSAVEVGDFYVSTPSLPLAPGGMYTQTESVTLYSYDVSSPGSYYLLVRANSNQTQAESDSSLSVASAPIVVTAEATTETNVDLVVSSATAPASGVARQSVAISYTVTNQGIDATTASWYDYVYLSSTPTLNNYSQYAAAIANPSSLAGGASYTVQQSITLPAGVGPGNEYLVFVANQYGSEGEQSEVNYDNNTYAVPITIDEPNLAAVSASITHGLVGSSPAMAVEGSQVTVSWTVQNLGNAAASGYWSDAIYLADTPVLGVGGSQVQITSFSESSESPLSPEGSYTTSQSITLPAYVVGARYLLVVADANGNLADPDRTNNVYAIPLTLTAPNLAISGVSVTPASVESGNGESWNIQWTVTNTSTINASQSWFDEVYLSPTPTYDPTTATYLTSASSRSILAAGNDYTTDLSDVAVSNIAPGNYYVIVVANQTYVYAALEGETDFTGQAETSPSDNVAAVPVMVTAPAVTLTVSNPMVASASVVVGQSVNVSFQVNNEGTEAAENTWSDTVFVSSQPTFSSSAQFVQSFTSQSPLAAGSHYVQSGAVTIPQNLTPGPYYLFFVANENREQGESSYAGNVSAALPITVNAPDLTIAVSNPPTTAQPGQQFSVSYTVTDTSSYDTTAYSWDDYVYLSSEPTLDYSAAYLQYLSYVYINNSTPLAAGKSYAQTQNFTIPADVTVGQQYYLLFIANLDNEQGVSNPADEIEATAITITATGVNLQVAANSVTMAAPTVPSIGAPLTVDWTVENVGSEPADGPWEDYVYISTSSSFNSSATLVDSVSTPASATPLAAGDSYNQSDTFTLPSTITAGDYYVYVVANGNDAQAETTTADNVSAAVPVTLAAPELQVTAVTAPASAVWGSSIPLSWTVQNVGAGAAAGTWYDAVYVSSNPQFDSSAQYLTDFYEGQSLAAGSSYSDTKNIYLTYNSAPITGPAYILIVPNYFGYLNENSSASDTGASDQIALSAPALSIGSLTAPAAAVAGGSISISWTVTNTSLVGTVSPWSDAVYLSPDNEFDSSAEFVANFAAPTTSLVAGASYMQNQDVTLPLIYTGPEYLIVVTDENNVQPQTNAANNFAVAPINVGAADLTVTSVTAPADADLGQPITVGWTVENIGQGPADEQWYDGIYYSRRNTFDSSAQRLAAVPVGDNSPLVVGDSYTQSDQVALPSGLTPGTYYILVDTNIFGDQPETNEGNNWYSSSAVTVTGADLTVSSASAPADAVFGQGFTVDWNVLNAGGGAATESWTDGIYISTKNTFDNTVQLLEEVPSGGNSPLAAGSSYDQNARATMPLTFQSTAGSYYLYVVANDQGHQAVTNSSDNVSAPQPIDLTLPPLPDLVPGSLSLPAAGYNGQQVLASWTDVNTGAAAATGPRTDAIYLASDAQGDNATLVGEATYSGTIAAGGQGLPLTQPIELPATPGTYYLDVVADASGLNEGPAAANDTTVDPTPITVVQEPLSDLVVTSITPPGSDVLSGNLVPVSFVVQNKGTAPTSVPVWQDWVILSQDPTLAQSYYPNKPLGIDQILNNQPVILGFDNPSYLDVGQSYTQTVEVPLPTNAQGTWYVYVVPDGTGGHHQFGMPELSRADKLAMSGGFTVTLTDPADLAVAGVQTAPQVFSGQPATVSWMVNNVGLGATTDSKWPEFSDGVVPANYQWSSNVATTWTDEVFMSPDATLDSSAIPLGNFTHTGALEPGGSYVNTQQVTLPVGVSGSYYFLVQTDIDGQVFEDGATANNVGATPAAVTVNLTPPPDLQTSILTAPAAALASHALTFTYQVSNIGAGPTALLNPKDVWIDAFYLSPTPGYNSATAIPLGTQTTSLALQPGGSYQNTITETVPDGLSGSFYLIVDADSGDAVFELDQTSKFGATATPIQVASMPADLVVTAASGPATGQAGGAVLLDWTVANQGSGDSAVTSWQDNVYADTGSSLSSNAILLGSYTHNGLLAAGDSYNQSQLVTLPINLSGPYNLFVVTNEPADPKDPSPVYELDTVNDTSAAVPVTVVQQLADLEATSVTAPTLAEAGSSATIQWTVQNIGAGATNTDYWFDNVWISTHSTLGSGGNNVCLGTVQHTNPLAAAGGYSASDQVTVPVNLPPGSYYFIVAVNRPVPPTALTSATTVNRVYESNETNNETAAATTLTAGPELVASAVSAPSTADVNQAVTIGWTVTNSGVGGTGSISIQDSVYLSYDQVFSDSAIYAGAVTRRR